MKCNNCKGNGEVKEHNFENEGQMHNIVTCSFCNGTGEYNMSKETFKQLFDDCMKDNTAYNEAGLVEVEPKCIIRDFDVEMPKLSDSNFNNDFDLNKCDTEFTDFEKAYNHLMELERVRIMSATGMIVFENY